MSYEVYSRSVDIMHEDLHLSRYAATFFPVTEPDTTNKMLKRVKIKYILYFQSKNSYSEYNRQQELEKLNLFIEEMRLKYEL
jgi:hypothetical protein